MTPALHSTDVKLIKTFLAVAELGGLSAAQVKLDPQPHRDPLRPAGARDTRLWKKALPPRPLRLRADRVRRPGRPGEPSCCSRRSTASSRIPGRPRPSQPGVAARRPTRARPAIPTSSWPKPAKDASAIARRVWWKSASSSPRSSRILEGLLTTRSMSAWASPFRPSADRPLPALRGAQPALLRPLSSAFRCDRRSAHRRAGSRAPVVLRAPRPPDYTLRRLPMSPRRRSARHRAAGLSHPLRPLSRLSRRAPGEHWDAAGRCARSPGELSVEDDDGACGEEHVGATAAHRLVLMDIFATMQDRGPVVPATPASHADGGRAPQPVTFRRR